VQTQTVLKIQNKSLRIKSLPLTPGSQSKRNPYIRRIGELSGIEAEKELEEGIQRSFVWYLKHVFQNKVVYSS